LRVRQYEHTPGDSGPSNQLSAASQMPIQTSDPPVPSCDVFRRGISVIDEQVRILFDRLKEETEKRQVCQTDLRRIQEENKAKEIQLEALELHTAELESRYQDWESQGRQDINSKDAEIAVLREELDLLAQKEKLRQQVWLARTAVENRSSTEISPARIV
jgi:hypothetical protein